jgi:hypothetical protein
VDDPRPLLSLRRVPGELGDNQAWVAELAQTLAELDAGGAKVMLGDV